MATFPIVLDSCLECDDRRVEPGDLVDLYIDLTKIPGATSPVRAVVLDVRVPVPPESVLGKVTLDVEVADADLPEGLTLLEPDDLTVVKCVDCCVKVTERVDVLEEQIVGTQETGFTFFSPFIPASFTAEPLDEVGLPYDFTRDGTFQSKPVYRVGGANPAFRIQDGYWTYTNAAGTATYTASIKAEFPWLQPNGTVWVRDPAGLNIVSGILWSNLVRSNTPILPTVLLPGSQADAQDLIILKDRNDTLWFWTGTTWRLTNELIPWDVAAEPGGPTASKREGPFVRATVQGNWDSGSGIITVYPGDIFWRNEQESGIPGQLLRIGVEGTWRNIGVTTNSVQVITAAKTWLSLQTFSTVDINGGAVDATVIGAAVPTNANFDDANILGSLGHGNPLTEIVAGTTSATAVDTWYHGATDFTITETLVQPTANRTQTKPDVSGYQSIVVSPTGKPKWNEVIGMYSGRANLIAGAVTVPIVGADGDWPVVATPEVDGTGRISAYCSSGSLYINSSDVADTRIISYIAIDNTP